MAILILGQSECSICSGTLKEGDAIVSTSAFIENENDPLWPYFDSGMHQHCFDNWSLRDQFIESFNEFYDRHYRGMRRMTLDGNIVDCEPR